MFRHPKARVLAWTLVACRSLLGSGLAHAGPKEDFDDCYLEAETAFEKGDFSEAQDRLESGACMGSEKFEDLKDRALLLVRTDIALNDRDSAKRHVEELLRSGYDEVPDAAREPELAGLVAEGRSELAATQTSSVSRVAEDIRLVPATVHVITAKQIRNRGYVDLEAVLRDVPGIDFSRGNGVSYSNLYMRGLRTDSSDRILFLIDGIEQNELHTNVAYISRQFSLSDVERVEVVFGPASTLYGANAYAGVINVVTRDGSDLLGEREVFGLRMDAGYGAGTRSMRSQVIDGQMILSDRKRRVSLSVAGRVYMGQEQDLSQFSTWDYASGKYDLDNRGEVYGETYPGDRLGGSWAEGGQLTEAKQEELRLADSQNLGAEDYYDASRNWSFRAKVKVGRRFEIGASGWSRLEGHSGWLRETAAPSVSGTRWNPSGAVWHPRMWAVHTRFSERISPTVSLTVFARYTTHDLGPRTRWYSEDSLASKLGQHSLFIEPEATSGSAFRYSARYRNSTMLRNEAFLSYQPNSKLSVVGGGDFRYGKIQGNYPTQGELDDDGNPTSQIGDQRLLWGAGLFSTVSGKPHEQLTLSAGLRYDYGKSDGYAIYRRGVLSPRAALVFASRDERWIAKLFYSRAFFNPTNWQRYTSSATRDPNPELQFETADNLEASVQTSLLGDGASDHRLLASTSVYGTLYDQVHQLRGTSFQSYRTRVLGNQTTLNYRYQSALDVFASYSYTFAQTRPEEELSGWESTTHIAPHKGNLGATLYPLALLRGRAGAGLKRSGLAVNLRTNIVGRRNGFCERLESEGEVNPWEALPQDEIDRCRPYATLNAALTYSRQVDYGVWWVQLSGLNLLNTQYSDPGVRETAIYAPAHPQPGASGFGRIGLEF